MEYDDLAARLATSRPRVAEELARPHAEESLLAHVVEDLAEVGAERSLAVALGLTGAVEQVLLWGGDYNSGAEDLGLAGALRSVAPGAGRAALLEAEPDLVVRTELEIALVDATVSRPGHAAARAERGEEIPGARLAEISALLSEHGFDMGPDDVAEHYAAARLASVAVVLGQQLGLRPVAVALGAGAGDLLKPERDPLAAWNESAAAILASVTAATVPLTLRALTWAELAERLDATGDAAAAAIFRIRNHPVLATPNS